MKIVFPIFLIVLCSGWLLSNQDSAVAREKENYSLLIQFLTMPIDNGMAWMEERAVEEGIDLEVDGITAIDGNTAFLYGSLCIGAGDVRSILLRTENGGKSWSETMAPEIGNTILEVLFDPSGLGFALSIWSVESPGEITFFRSSDFGKSWKTVTEIPSRSFDVPLRMSFNNKESGNIYLFNWIEEEASVRIISTKDSGNT